MIVLDTNVASEPMKTNPNPAVIAWLDRQDAANLYLTATSLSELLTGIEILPPGKRRVGLGAALGQLITDLFHNRILPFDEPAARVYATIIGEARIAGHAISIADGQIAAIAATQGFSVATRDIGPFRAAGLSILNPWSEAQ